ncbi:GntR family transcriptional regulator [Nocardiopsis mangrovi]|uniref:GntR family transcriptional regulator n=1 Tax=Nocardiopsis mangrovi TaxID=1179818 RepID=A0ABV9E2V8_9ACTN
MASGVVQRRGGGRRSAGDLSTSIATQIIDLARRNALPEGAHLREQWVADSLRVSRSPVRRAMAFLAELGIVEQVPNRGFFLTRAAVDIPGIDVGESADAEEDAYFQIADDHLGGRFGGEFTTAEVARRYGLSPRAAQRVLTRMEGEDLLRRRPGRGWEFLGVLSTTEAHDQSYRFRMIVEPAALLEPGYRVDPQAFAEHRARQESLLGGDILTSPRARLYRTGAEFHEMLVGCAGNSFVSEALRRQNRVRRLIEYRHQFDRARLLDQAREHLALLDLVEAGRLDEASALLHAHLDRVRWLKTGHGPEPEAPRLPA